MRAICCILLLWNGIQAQAQQPKNSITTKSKQEMGLFCGPRTYYRADPLYVVDGSILNRDSLGVISPESIQSISILKPEQAARIFGKRGKLGAILVNTRKENLQWILVRDMADSSLIIGATVTKGINTHYAQTNENGFALIEKQKENNPSSVTVRCAGYLEKTFLPDVNGMVQEVWLEKHVGLMETVVVRSENCKKVICFSSGVSTDECSLSLKPTSISKEDHLEQSKALSFTAYPNPAPSGSTVTLGFGKAFTGRIELLNGAGQLIQIVQHSAKPADHLQFQVPSLPAGIYWVRLLEKENGKGVSRSLVIL